MSFLQIPYINEFFKNRIIGFQCFKVIGFCEPRVLQKAPKYYFILPRLLSCCLPRQFQKEVALQRGVILHE
jgi:hypothetical protein